MKKALVLLLVLVFVLTAACAAFAYSDFPAPEMTYAHLIPVVQTVEAPKGMWAVFTVGDTRYYSAPAGTEMWEYRPELLQYYQIAQERMSHEKKADVAPFIMNDRVLVPMRYLAYALGASDKDVVWDEANRTVTLRIKTADESKTVEVVLKIGSNVLYKDGKPVQMDVAPIIKDGRTFLPARFVAEAAGYGVDWDDTYRGVLVGPPGKLPVHPKRVTPPVDRKVIEDNPGGAVGPLS